MPAEQSKAQKVALVTGAARGIGLATARLFIEEGWLVAALDRDADALQKAAADLGQAASAFVCDVSDPGAVDRTVADVLSRFGRIDALVFRAIAWRHLDSLELADDDIRRALALAPDNLDALLESGTIRRRKGDNDGARRAWLRVLKRAPDGSTADAARSNLERMDGNKRR